jgi:hypothetical protein
MECRRLHTAVCETCVMSACVYRRSKCCRAPGCANSSCNSLAGNLIAFPAIAMRALLQVDSPPRNRATPRTPSFPTKPISAVEPSCMVYNNETTEFVGK